MRTIRLTEHRPSQPIPLTTTELAHLQDSELFSISPDRSPGSFTVTPGSRIGTVVFPDLQVLIRPKISMENIFFLLGFRPQLVEWGERFFQYDTAKDLLGAVARMFDTAIQRAAPRGIARGYRSMEEALPTVRGRINIGAQIARRKGAVFPLECVFDEFTEDILLNQMLKAALTRLRPVGGIEESVQRNLAFRRLLFREVTEVDFQPASVPALSFTRLNLHWEPAARLAQLILRQQSVRDENGRIAGSSFLVDMNLVFEKFLEEALRDRLRVRGFEMAAQKNRPLTDQVNITPDFIVQRNGADLVVADAKYKVSNIGEWDSGNLYQMLAYCVALRIKRGMLVYATHRAPEVQTVTSNGVQIELVGIDLGARPAQILVQADQLARKLAGYAERELLARVGAA